MTITEADELDALPLGAVVLDRAGRAYQKRLPGREVVTYHPVPAWQVEPRWWMASWRPSGSTSKDLARLGVRLVTT